MRGVEKDRTKERKQKRKEKRESKGDNMIQDESKEIEIR